MDFGTLDPYALAQALKGIAPYGFRHIESPSEMALPKGKGYFGALPNQGGGVSTEISANTDIGAFPLLSPNMSASEIQTLLANQDPTEAMYKKAEDWAKYRQSQGQSPFASPLNELRWSKP